MRESILGSPCASLHRVETSLRTSTSNWWRPEEEHSHPRESRLYTVRARGRLPLGSKYDLVPRTSRKGTRFENQTLDLSGILSCGFRVRFIVDRKHAHRYLPSQIDSSEQQFLNLFETKSHRFMRCASEKVIRFQRMRSRARTLRNNSLLKTVVAEKYFRTRLTHSNLICNAIAGGAVLNESEVITKSFF